MITRKKLFALSGLALALCLSACGPKEEEKPQGGANPSSSPTASGTSAKKLVGVSLSSRNHNFFLGMEQGVTDELKAQGLDMEAAVAEDSASKQQEQIDLMIRKGVAAIIMVPVDAQQAITAVEAANKANIPIFCIDRRVTDANAKVTATIETDNVAMGEEAAKHALKLLCERRKLDPNKPQDVKKLKTTVVHLWGLEAASSAQDRAKGFEKVFNPTTTPEVKIVKLVGNFNAKTAQEVSAPALTANPEIELMFCHNDDNAIGALNAILDLKKEREVATDPRRVLIVGMDGNKAAVEEIRKGNIEATVSQQPIQMGVETVKQVKKVIDGGKPDKEYIAIPHILLTQKEADAQKGKLWSDQLRETR